MGLSGLCRVRAVMCDCLDTGDNTEQRERALLGLWAWLGGSGGQHLAAALGQHWGHPGCALSWTMGGHRSGLGHGSACSLSVALSGISILCFSSERACEPELFSGCHSPSQGVAEGCALSHRCLHVIHLGDTGGWACSASGAVPMGVCPGGSVPSGLWSLAVGHLLASLSCVSLSLSRPCFSGGDRSVLNWRPGVSCGLLVSLGGLSAVCGAGRWPALISGERPESWFFVPAEPFLKPGPRVSGKTWPSDPRPSGCAPSSSARGHQPHSTLPDSQTQALCRGPPHVQLLPSAGLFLTGILGAQWSPANTGGQFADSAWLPPAEGASPSPVQPKLHALLITPCVCPVHVKVSFCGVLG